MLTTTMLIPRASRAPIVDLPSLVDMGSQGGPAYFHDCAVTPWERDWSSGFVRSLPFGPLHRTPLLAHTRLPG